MSQETPSHHDAELAMRAYELRTETVMRESRNTMNGKFWPKSYEDFVAITKMDHPWNAAFRQTSSYWEMVYSFVRYGAVHAELFLESNGEGIFMFAKIAPYLERFRKEQSPTAFSNTEWVVNNTDMGKKRFQMLKQRVEQMISTQK